MNYQKIISCLLVLLLANSCKKDEKVVEAQYPAYYKFKKEGVNTITEGMAHSNLFSEYYFYTIDSDSIHNFRRATLHMLNVADGRDEIYNGSKPIWQTWYQYPQRGAINKKNDSEPALVFNFNGEYSSAAGVLWFNADTDRPSFGKAVYDRDLVGAINVGDGVLVFGAKVNGNDRQVLVTKYDTSFSYAIWEKEFGGAGDDMAIDAVKLCDNNYAILAYTHSKGAGNRDIWYLKMDKDGYLISDTTYGGSGDDDPKQIIRSNSCYLYIAGNSNKFSAGGQDGYLLCLNEKGEKAWEKTYGTPMQDGFTTLSLLPFDKGIVAAGNSAQGIGQPEDIFVVATALNGNEIWRKKYGEPNLAEIPKQILVDGDFYYLASTRFDAKGNSDAVFIKDKLTP